MSRYEGPLKGKAKPLLGDPFRHIWLTRKVAEGAGVDFDAALHEGLLSKHEHMQMVTKCRLAGCDGPCALHIHGPDRDKAPGFCANKDIFERLQKAQSGQAVADKTPDRKKP